MAKRFRVGIALTGAVLFFVASHVVAASGSPALEEASLREFESPRIAGLTLVRGREKTQALRQVDFTRDPRCYVVFSANSNAKWILIGFSEFAVSRYQKCEPFDGVVIATIRGGQFRRVAIDNLRNPCRVLAANLTRAGAPTTVVRDMLSIKGCPRGSARVAA